MFSLGEYICILSIIKNWFRNRIHLSYRYY